MFDVYDKYSRPVREDGMEGGLPTALRFNGTTSPITSDGFHRSAQQVLRGGEEKSGFEERAWRQSPGCLALQAVLRNGFKAVFISAVSNVPRFDSPL